MLRKVLKHCDTPQKEQKVFIEHSDNVMSTTHCSLVGEGEV